MDSKKELKTGLFVILTLTAVIFTVNYLRGNGLFEKSRTFITSYSDVQGLNPATPVYINGFKAGSVSGIEYDKSRNIFDIKLSVSGDFDIPDDSETEIFSSDILGGKSIRIIYGTSRNAAASGDTLPGTVCRDPLSGIMAGLAPIISNIDTLTADLKITVKSINEVLDENNRSGISAIVSSLRRSAADIESITSKVEKRTPEINDIIMNLKDISSTFKLSAEKLDSTLTNAESISYDLKDAGLKQTVEDIDLLIRKLQNPDGSLGRMMETDTLHNSLNSLVNDLDSLVNKIKGNPRKNLKISVF